MTQIALGATNKEIAHELGITERGASAQVSRLLELFDTPNRAALIASVLAESYAHGAAATARTSASGQSVDHLDLSAFDDSPLLVTVTMGKDHVITYRNKVARQLASGVDPRSIDLHPARERFADEGAARVRERATEAFVRGVTLTAADTSVRWQNDDGTWTGGLFSWVLQPLTGASGAVEAILWIGTHRPLPDQWEK